MVGYNPKQDVQLSKTEYGAAGAISGAITRALCQPLDVLKIRFQLQVDPIRKSEISKYWGVYHACKTVVRDEGWRAFWKGHVPAQGLSVMYGIVQYTSFEISTKLVWDYGPENLTVKYRPLTHTLCGGVAGSVATLAIHPVDVLRTRFVAQGEPKVYRSLRSACVSIWQYEGVRGFYRGLLPALSLTGPQMGMQFGLYSLFTSTWNSAFGTDSTALPGTAESLICGSGSGFVAKLIIYPLDVIKKRLQIQGFEKARLQFGTFHHYTGFLHCCSKILQTEGLRGLYKGLVPSLLKAAAVAGCNFCVYDQTYEGRSVKLHKDSFPN